MFEEIRVVVVKAVKVDEAKVRTVLKTVSDLEERTLRALPYQRMPVLANAVCEVKRDGTELGKEMRERKVLR